MMEATEQVDMTNEELAEVHGYAPIHEVEEHEATRVVLHDADGQLIREAADRLPRRRSERDVRVLLWPQSSLLRVVEEGALIAFGTQSPAASIAQHGIENHHPFDHAADRAKTTVPVVRLANRLVERLVVDVVQASTSDRPWFDGSRESAGHQPCHELPAVLPARRAGELAVLALEKTPGVDHDGHKETTLARRQVTVT
jgi:hypothetical protein